MRVVLVLLVGCAPAVGSEPATLWIADPGAGVVFRDDAVGRSVVVDAGVSGARPGFDPSALVVDDRGHLLVADFANHTVSRYDDGALALLFENPSDPDATRIEEPCGLLAGPGTVAVLANDTENIAFLDDGGAVLSELGPESLLRNAHGFAVLPDGYLVVVGSADGPGDPVVRTWDPLDGRRVGSFAPWPELEEPTDVVVLADGTLAITDWGTGRVLRYDPTTGAQLDVLAEGLSHPVALAAQPSGVVLVLADDGVWTTTGERVVDGAGFVFPRDLVVTW
jgi:streptogramin lyase